MVKIIGLYREFELQGKHENDQRILDLTASELREKGFEVSTKDTKDFSEKENPDLIFTMARGKEINELLMRKEKESIFVINSPKAIRLSFNRRLAYQRIMEAGVNVFKTRIVETNDIKFSDLKCKSILKPSNRHEFWFVVENKSDFEKGIQECKDHDIEKIMIQRFVEGKHIKYYAVGDEIILPSNIEKEFSLKIIKNIKKQIRLTGEAIKLKIFGGDFIIEKGIPFCVDVNDWPSMGSIENFTQENIAIKIAELIEKEYNNFRNIG